MVGTGARAEMFVRALVHDHADSAELVALVDPNPARAAAYNRLVERLGAPPVPVGGPEALPAVLAEERVDTVVVTSPDHTHADHVVTALAADCSVITEKPMTTDVTGCRRILDAAAKGPGTVTVTFNYRYNPVHEQVWRLLHDQVIGEILSVHFEWLLDVRHGADYFRRWHRNKAHSGGLLVHKAGHHFDLVNWWLGAAPVQVAAQGRLAFYGPENGRRNGYARDYARAHGSPEADGDPFALHLADSPRLRELYLDAEHEDGYHRDQNVFAPGITIEDDLALLVRYDTGATMSYHLTAYAPWEGYRIAFNGSRGRLELEVVESDHVSPAAATGLKGAPIHGVDAAAEQGSLRLQVRRFWEPPEDVPVPAHRREGHGGGDARMLADLFGADGPTDPLHRGASERDGALALLTGLAGNRSLATGGALVTVADLLELPR